MVVRSGFEIQLVSADTKIPFKEHEKDGKVYVEAEPDAEYFIAVRRADSSGPHYVVGSFYIDGKFLGYCTAHRGVEKKPCHKGVFSRTNGVSKHVALKFSKPKLAKDGDGYSGGMGKAEVKLYEGIYKGTTTAYDYAPDFDNALASAANAGDGKKKFLLTSKGSTSVSHINSAQLKCFAKGNLIDSIVLHYCSVLGLIEVGVLPKPDLWVHEQMKHPARNENQDAVLVKVKKDPVDSTKLIEFIDLSGEK